MSHNSRLLNSSLFATAIGIFGSAGLNLGAPKTPLRIVRPRRQFFSGAPKGRTKGKPKPPGAKLARAAARHQLGINKRGY